MSSLAKTLVMGAGLGIGSLLAAPIAGATSFDVAAPPTGMAQAAVTSAAAAAHGPLGQAFTESTAERLGKNPKALMEGATQASGSPVSVYLLNPDFVKSGRAPIGTFSYAAMAYTLNGIPATVDTIYRNGAWKSANIATGQDEQVYAKQAGGAPLLYEPQVHAWYAVKGQRLEALNTSAQKAIGAPAITVANYARGVHAKYAAMMPGSSYDTSGKAGGFQDAPAKPSSGVTNVPVAGAAAAVGAAVVGGGFALRRRRHP